jgi:hypothetical protein
LFVRNLASNAQDDYSPSTNSSFNANPNTGKRSPIEENPTVNIGADNAALKLAINTAQVGRVFQDRSHSFTIKNRYAEWIFVCSSDFSDVISFRPCHILGRCIVLVDSTVPLLLAVPPLAKSST